MLSAVETQILLADIVAVFIAWLIAIIGVTIVDILVSKASTWFKTVAYIIFVLLIIIFLKPIAECFLKMDEFFRSVIGRYDVSDLVEPMKRLIRTITNYVGKKNN